MMMYYGYKPSTESKTTHPKIKTENQDISRTATYVQILKFETTGTTDGYDLYV